MTTSCDAIILGAGQEGGLLSLALADADLQIALVEREIWEGVA